MAKLKKQVETSRGTANAVIPLTSSPYSVRVNYGSSEGIMTGTPADWFGPLNPMAPIAPPEVSGRRFDFIPGYNLATTPRSFETVGFGTLRALGDSYDLLRLVIETRKDQIARMQWGFRVATKDKRGKKKDASPGQQAKIDELTKLWKRPDGINRWRAWLRGVLEDVFVIDAPSLYVQRNRGGKAIAFKQIDGATVKVVLDDWGRTPMPYQKDGKLFYPPAYQQVLKGLPAVNYSVKDLIYRPTNRRANKAYGYSVVEQIIMTVNIALRRQMFTLSYYTEGNVPEALIGTPDTWTPEQINAFQQRWDTMLSGNLAQRRHALFVPSGVGKTMVMTKEQALMDKMDEWLARVVCFAFSISPQPFVQTINRATAEVAQEGASEEGVEPLKEYIRELVDDCNEQEFGIDPGEIEFFFEEENAVDPQVQTTILVERVSNGVISLNEAREDLGEEKSDNPAADLLMLKTATGFVPIEANTPEAKAEAIKLGLTADPTAPKIMAAPPGGAVPGDGSASGGSNKGKPGANGKGGKKPAPAAGAAKPAAKKGFDAPHEPHAVLTDSMAKAARRARRLAAVPFEPKAAKKAVAAIKRALSQALKTVARGVAHDVRQHVGKLAKAKRKTPSQIADDADLSAIDAVIFEIADALGEAAGAQAEAALAQVGPDAPSDLVDQVNEEAVNVARNIGAELVGKRFDEDGNLIDNPDAAYRIDESTRDMIRTTIADGLEQNIGADEIANLIEDGTGFSADRAELIAYTEVRRANSSAAVVGYKGARDEMGLNVKKEWLLGDNPCPICEDNADDGAIDLDDSFSSGDDAPPAHPNCECAIAPVVEDDGEASADEEA